MAPAELSPHHLKIALLQPQIAPNTGNIARLCVATATALHLIRPMGFVLSDQKLRRSAMDYWPRLQLTLHDDTQSWLNHVADTPLWFFSSKAERSFWDADFKDGDWLVFGNESRGLPAPLYDRFASRLIRIPQQPHERCLNLATSAGIALYHALKCIDSNSPAHR